MIEVPMENFVNEFNMWMQTVQSELQEKSMRSTIIICAATLDAQLEKLIKNILLQEKNTDGDIFEGGNAILSTFSSKITFAYYLGLISEHERKTLDCIRKIRNKAAHEISILSGSVSDSINNMCLNLEIPQGQFINRIILYSGKWSRKSFCVIEMLDIQDDLLADNIEFFVAPNSYCKISANATRMVKYITHCDVYFSKRKKVYITLDFGDKLSKRYCTQIRTYEFLQMLISETEAYQDLNIDTLF